MDVIAQFADTIAAAGLRPDGIIPDGRIHRCHVEGDKPGTRNGWYSLHLDGTPAGIYGSWKTSEVSTWCSVSKDRQTPRQRAAIRRMIERARAQRRAETAEKNAIAANRAEVMLKRSQPAAPNHPYLASKGVKPHGIRQQGNALLVPVFVSDTLSSIQSIRPDGAKRFLPGGRIGGGCYRIANEPADKSILIAEGFATAATLHERTGAACYVAFSACNLLSVARYVRSLHPEGCIVVCADNDLWTEGNPGVTKARMAAIAVKARLLVPDFSKFDESGKLTDWNDWYRLRDADMEDAAA